MAGLTQIGQVPGGTTPPIRRLLDHLINKPDLWITGGTLSVQTSGGRIGKIDLNTEGTTEGQVLTINAEGAPAWEVPEVTAVSPVLTTPRIKDASGGELYVFAVSDLAEDRTVTLPLLDGDATFVFEAHTATLTNKTIALVSNTVSGTKAQFDTAVTDGNIAFDGGAHHNSFSDFVANKHIDHTAVQVTIEGTANQINSSAGAQDISDSRTWTLSTPQDIHTGATPTFAGANLDGAVTINDAGADVDFRVETQNEAHAIDVDAANDRIGLFFDTATTGGQEPKGPVTIMQGPSTATEYVLGLTKSFMGRGAVTQGGAVFTCNSVPSPEVIFDSSSGITITSSGADITPSGDWPAGLSTSHFLEIQQVEQHTSVSNDTSDELSAPILILSEGEFIEHVHLYESAKYTDPDGDPEGVAITIIKRQGTTDTITNSSSGAVNISNVLPLADLRHSTHSSIFRITDKDDSSITETFTVNLAAGDTGDFGIERQSGSSGRLFLASSITNTYAIGSTGEHVGGGRVLPVRSVTGTHTDLQLDITYPLARYIAGAASEGQSTDMTLSVAPLLPIVDSNTGSDNYKFIKRTDVSPEEISAETFGLFMECGTPNEMKETLDGGRAITGGNFVARHRGSGDVANLIGGNFGCTFSSNDNYLQDNVLQTGSVTEATAVAAANTGSFATNQYAFRATNANDNNYFAGNVGIGAAASTPEDALHIDGALRLEQQDGGMAEETDGFDDSGKPGTDEVRIFTMDDPDDSDNRKVIIQYTVGSTTYKKEILLDEQSVGSVTMSPDSAGFKDVTIDALHGSIVCTSNQSTIGNNNSGEFTVTNSKVSEGDVVMCSLGNDHAKVLLVNTNNVSNGSFKILVTNLSSTQSTEEITLNFRVIPQKSTHWSHT